MSNETPNQNLYTGEYRHGMDSKNRITIPAVWRSAEGGGEFYIRVNGEKSCLQVLTREAYYEALARYKNQPGLSVEQREYAVRMFSSKAFLCTFDKQGRMVLPPHLCQAIDTSDGVVLVGATDRFEVWNPQRWEELKAAEEEAFNRLSKSLGL